MCKQESIDQLLIQAADCLSNISISECIEYNKVAEHLREQRPAIEALVKAFAKIDALDPEILKPEPEPGEWPKPKQLSSEETKKYHELVAKIAESYSVMQSNAERMKTYGWERFPELLGYEQQTLRSILEDIEKIDAIDRDLICLTNTKPLGEFHARSPDELIEHLKGSLAPTPNGQAQL